MKRLHQEADIGRDSPGEKLNRISGNIFGINTINRDEGIPHSQESAVPRQKAISGVSVDERRHE
jgi:hypothetical protein